MVAFALLYLATGRARQAPVLIYVLAVIFGVHLFGDLVARLF